MPDFKQRIFADLVEAYGKEELPEFSEFSARLDNDEEYVKGIYTNIKTAYGDQYELSKLGEQGFLSELKKKVVSEPSSPESGTPKSPSTGEKVVYEAKADVEKIPVKELKTLVPQEAQPVKTAPVEVGAAPMAEDPTKQLLAAQWGRKPMSKEIVQMGKEQAALGAEPLSEKEYSTEYTDARLVLDKLPSRVKAVIKENNRDEILDYLKDNPYEMQRMARWIKDPTSTDLQSEQIVLDVLKKAVGSTVEKDAYAMEELDRLYGTGEKLKKLNTLTTDLDKTTDELKKYQTQVEFYQNQYLKSKGNVDLVNQIKATKTAINGFDYKGFEKQVGEIKKQIEPIGVELEQFTAQYPNGIPQELYPQYQELYREYQAGQAAYNDLINNPEYLNYQKNIETYNGLVGKQQQLIGGLTGDVNYKKALEGYEATRAKYDTLRGEYDEMPKDEIQEYLTRARKVAKGQDVLNSIEPAFPIAVEREKVQKAANDLRRIFPTETMSQKAITAWETIPEAVEKTAGGALELMSKIGKSTAGLDEKSTYTLTDQFAEYLNDFGKINNTVVYESGLTDVKGDINWGELPVESLRQIGNLAVFATVGKFTGGTGVQGMVGSTVARNSPMVATAYFMSRGDRNREAEQAGLKGTEKELYVSTLSLLEGLSELIMPDNQLFTKPVRNKLLAEAVEGVAKGKNWYTKQALATIAENAGKEGAEELVVKLGELLEKTAVNYANGNVFDVEEYKNYKEWVATALVAAPLAGISTSIGQIDQPTKQMNADLYRAATNVTASREVLDAMVEKGKITAEQADKVYKKVVGYAALKDIIPQDISPEKAVELAPIIEENETIKMLLKDADDIFKPRLQEALKQNIEKAQEILSRQDESTRPIEPTVEGVTESVTTTDTGGKEGVQETDVQVGQEVVPVGEEVSGSALKDIKMQSQYEFAQYLQDNHSDKLSQEQIYKLLTVRPELRERMLNESPQEWAKIFEKNPDYRQQANNVDNNKEMRGNANPAWTGISIGETANQESDGRHKGYVTLSVDSAREMGKNLEQTFKDLYKKLKDAGYNGHLKMPGVYSDLLTRFDNIVIHGATKGDISLALPIIEQYFKDKGLTVEGTKTGIDAKDSNGKETSHTNLLAEKVKNKQVEEGLNEQKPKLSPKRMVGQLTKDLPNKGNRKTLTTAMGDLGHNYNIGDVEVTLTEDEYFGEINGEQEQADVAISFIGVTNKGSRGNGLASKELDRIIKLADERGMSLSLLVDADAATIKEEKENALTNEQLKDWYKRRGFVFDEYSSYGYRKPQSIKEPKQEIKDETEKEITKGESPEVGLQQRQGTTGVERVKKINDELLSLKEKNPEQFKKDGTPKAKSKIAPAYNALLQAKDAEMQKMADSFQDEFNAIAREESENSRIATQKLNEEFEARQKELEKFIPEGDLQEEKNFDEIERIFDKVKGGELATPEEIAFVNENAWLPNGFVFAEDGLTEESSVTTPAEKESVAEEVKETAKPEAEEEGKVIPTTDEKRNEEGREKRREILLTEEGGMKEAPPSPESVAEKKAKAEKTIDEAANWLKEKLRVDLPEGTKKAGFGQDELIDLVANAVKALVNTGIEVSAAVKQVMDSLREGGFLEGMDEAEITAKAVPSPKQMRRFSRQIINEFPELENMMSEQALFYTTLPNAKALKEANDLINYLGEEEARKAYTDTENGLGGAVRSIMGMALLKRYQERGDYEAAVDIAEEVAQRGTELGREIQAFSMFAALSPEGFLISSQRVVNKGRERRAKQDKPRTDNLNKKMNKANKESADEVLETEPVKKRIEKVQKIEPKVTVRDRAYGEKNTIVTKKRYEDLKKQLRGKFFSSPVTPELIELGIYHVEAGARTFAEFSKNLIEDLGNKVKPYLKEMYVGARNEMGSEGFSTDEEILRAEAEEKGQALVKQIDTALKAKNRKALKSAIAELQNVAKQSGLWGKYKSLAVQRLKTLTSQNIKDDISETAVLDEFTKGLVKNIRQQQEQMQPQKQGQKKEVKPAIEIIADAYKNFEKYEDIWAQTVSEYKEANAGNDEKLEQLDAYFGEITLSPFSDRLVGQAVKEGLKSMNVSIADVVKQHYTVYDYTLKTLTQKLVEQAGLEQAEAKDLADAIQREFDRIATEKKQEALEKIFSKKERKKPEIKTLESEIIRLTNLGAFTDTELLNTWAEKMGYPKLTPENVKEIQRLANAVQESTEGFKKFRAIEDLLAYQANLKGISAVDVGMAVWYANILSGFTTQEVNLVANIINSALLYVNAVAQNPLQAKFIGTGFIEGLKRGWLESKETFKTGYSPIRGKVEVPNVLERKKFTGWATPMNYWKYVARTMKASDVLIFEAQKEMRAYQLAVKMAGKDETVLAPNQTIRDKAAELVGATSGLVEAAQAQSDLEYEQALEDINSQQLTESERKDKIKQAEIDRNRRVYELLEQGREKTIQGDSAIYASRGTYNYKPEGALGWMASTMNMAKDALERTAENSDTKTGKAAAQALKILVNTVVPFTNIIANVANENINYTPYGALRAASGKSSLTGFNAKELSREEIVDLYTKSIMGTSLLVALYALSQSWGDDDEPLIEITANGHGDYRKNYDLQNSGWQPYSVKVGKTWYSYQYSPLMITLSYLGNIRDYEKYRGEKMTDKGLSDLAAVAGSATTRSLLDMTFLSSLNSFLSAAMDPRNDDAVNDFFSGAKKTAVSTIVPNLYVQTAKEVENIFNIPIKEVRGTYGGAILQHVPYARNQYFDKINGLGEVIVPDTDKLISFSKDDKLWNLIAEKGGYINVPNIKIMEIYDPATEKMRAYTPKEYYDFSIARGEYLKSLLNANYEELKELSSKDFKEWLSKANTKANKVGKESLYNDEE